MPETTAPAGPLSPEQYEFFFREGYLVKENLLSDADLQPVIDEITAEIDKRARALVEEGALSRTYEEEPFETRLAKISAETDRVAKGIWNGILSGAGIFDLLTNERLLDVAEQLCGEELIASSVYRLRPKIPNYNYGAVPWHQDSGYFEPFCDDALVLTVWLPLVDATPENGCLYVLPRAHHGELLPHHSVEDKPYLRIAEEELPAGEPVCCPVPKGGVLLMTNRTPHVSYLNETGGVRWSMDLRYQHAKLPTNAPITRLEGEYVGDEENVPPACFPPEADFLVRSKHRPSEVVTDPETFDKLRKHHQGRPPTQRWDQLRVY